MEFLATKQTVSREQILGVAKGKGGLLGKIMVRRPMHELELEYIKFFLISVHYNVAARKFLFGRRDTTGAIHVVVNGLYGKCAVQDGDFALENAEGKHFQDGIYEMDEAEAAECAKNFARRVILRLCRNMPLFTQTECQTFFRPHWIAYYGDASDERRRYLPFEADGMSFRR